MDKINISKQKHELKIEYMERINKSSSSEYSMSLEHHTCCENNGCIYYISLEDSNFVYWKQSSSGNYIEKVISLVEYDEQWNIDYCVSKIYLDGVLIWDIDNYEPKSYLWYSEHDKDYFIAYYLKPKNTTKLPKEVSLDIDKLINEGGIFSSSSIFEKFQEIADMHYRGYFTITKVGSEWKCGFGTITSISQIQNMPSAKTVEEAMIKAIDDRHVYKD